MLHTACPTDDVILDGAKVITHHSAGRRSHFLNHHLKSSQSFKRKDFPFETLCDDIWRHLKNDIFRWSNEFCAILYITYETNTY